jgi:hypothetical protein
LPRPSRNCEIAVRNGTTDRGEIVGEALELAGVVRHVEVATRTVVEGSVEVEVPGGAVVAEEAVETGPGAAHAAVGSLNEPMEIITQGFKKPQGDLYIDGLPGGVENRRSGAFSDVFHGLIHGEKRDDDLAPLGVVCAGGRHLELDVV